MFKFYQNTIQPSVEALTRMQNRGILIDPQLRQEVKHRTEKELTDIELWLKKNIPIEFNPGSPKQVAKLVYEDWRLPKQQKRGAKNPTTEADALTYLARKFPIYAGSLRTILKHRQLKKLLTTYVDSLLSETNRMHTSYNCAGTVTGRISSSKTIDGYGGNLQNIPRGSFRQMFVADPGKVLIKADYSQAEFRCVAWFSHIKRIIENYTTNPFFDIHLWNASENIFRKSEDLVSKEERQTAKNIVYLSNYKGKPLRISRTYDIDLQVAKEGQRNYYDSMPELKVWWKKVEEELRTTRTLTNPFGRRRVFLGRVDETMFREGYSHYCQSIVADLILKAIVTLDQFGLELLLQVHDEIVLQCPYDLVESTIKQVKTAMEIPIPVDGESDLIIPVEILVGENWYDTTSFEEWKQRRVSRSTESDAKTLDSSVGSINSSREDSVGGV